MEVLHVSLIRMDTSNCPKMTGLCKTPRPSLLNTLLGFTTFSSMFSSNCYPVWRSLPLEIISPQDFTADCCRSPAARWALRCPCVLQPARYWPWQRPGSPRSLWGSSVAQRFSEPPVDATGSPSWRLPASHGGTPQMVGFSWKIPQKMDDDLGVPPFQSTPISQ